VLTLIQIRGIKLSGLQKKGKTYRKSIWRSKAFWSAVATAILGVLEALGVHVPPAVYTILLSFGIYAFRSAGTGTKTKPWYKSKAFWTTVATGAVGIAQAAGLDVPQFVVQILAAAGLYSIRVANTKLEVRAPAAVAAIRG